MQTSHRFCDALDGHAHSLIESAEKYATYQVDTNAPVACPVCQTVLQRTRLAHASVDIDYCAHHGSWFDKGELIRIAQAAAVRRAYGAQASQPQAVMVASQTRAEESGIDGEYVAEGAVFGLEILLALAEGFAD
jgi:Zn-finger nucleic acid-binding protein